MINAVSATNIESKSLRWLSWGFCRWFRGFTWLLRFDFFLRGYLSLFRLCFLFFRFLFCPFLVLFFLLFFCFLYLLGFFRLFGFFGLAFLFLFFCFLLRLLDFCCLHKCFDRFKNFLSLFIGLEMFPYWFDELIDGFGDCWFQITRV